MTVGTSNNATARKDEIAMVALTIAKAIDRAPDFSRDEADGLNRSEGWSFDVKYTGQQYSEGWSSPVRGLELTDEEMDTAWADGVKLAADIRNGAI